MQSYLFTDAEILGYMDLELYDKSYKAYEKLMEELKRKNPTQYNQIHGGL